MQKKFKKYKNVKMMNKLFIVIATVLSILTLLQIQNLNAQIIQQFDHRFLNAEYNFTQQYQKSEIYNHQNENVEADIRVSRDGNVYLYHDLNLALRGKPEIATADITPQIAKQYNITLFNKWFDENKLKVNNIMLELKNRHVDESVLTKIHNEIKNYKSKIIINSFLRCEDDANKLKFFKDRGYKVMIDIASDDKATLTQNIKQWNNKFDGLFISKEYLSDPTFENIISNWNKGIYIWTVSNIDEEYKINPWLVNHLNKFSEIGTISKGKNYNESLKESGMKTIEKSTLSPEKKNSILLDFLNNVNNYKDEISFFNWLGQFNSMFNQKNIKNKLHEGIDKLPVSNDAKEKLFTQLNNSIKIINNVFEIEKMWNVTNNNIKNILKDEGTKIINSSKLQKNEKDEYIKRYTKESPTASFSSIFNFTKWKEWFDNNIKNSTY